MRQLLFSLVVAAASALCLSGAAQASVITSLIAGNDDEADVNANVFDAGSGLTLIGKWDGGPFEGQPFTFNSTTSMSGSWSSTFDVLAVAIKAGPNFLLVDYTMDGAVQSGNWCTDGSCSVDGNLLPMVPNGSGKGPADISHLSLYGRLVTTPGVPEPGTWMLMILGFGVIGLAIKNRRRMDDQHLAYDL